MIDETLSPTWDEMLIMKEVEMFGSMEEIFDDPPTIVVEIFDKDKVVMIIMIIDNPVMIVDKLFAQTQVHFTTQQNW